jgi:hypothetical protein
MAVAPSLEGLRRGTGTTAKAAPILAALWAGVSPHWSILPVGRWLLLPHKIQLHTVTVKPKNFRNLS